MRKFNATSGELIGKPERASGCDFHVYFQRYLQRGKSLRVSRSVDLEKECNPTLPVDVLRELQKQVVAEASSDYTAEITGPEQQSSSEYTEDHVTPLPRFAPQEYGYSYQPYDTGKVRSWAIALGDSFQRQDVQEFSRRLIRELCETNAPMMSEGTFWQLARWCDTGSAYETGMQFAQNMSLAVFGRIIRRRDKAA